MPFSPLNAKTLDFVKPILTAVTLPSLDGQDKRIPLITRTEFNSLRALGGYAKRDGLFGGIATMFHRIWNAVKAIFGQSDWQRAERTLCTLAQRLVPYIDTLDLGLQDHEMQMIKMIAQDAGAIKSFVHENIMPEIIPRINEVNKSAKEIPSEALPVINMVFNWFDTDAIEQEPRLFEFATELGQRIAKEGQSPQLTFEIFGKLKEKGFIKAEVGEQQVQMLMQMMYGPDRR